MAERSDAERLGRELANVQSHLEQGNQRIKAWYSDEFEPPDGLPDIERPPHQRLMESGAELILYAAETISPGKMVFDPGYEATAILSAVGMEKLVGGIHLKLEPDDFISNLEETGKTPRFQKSRDVVEGNLEGTVQSSERIKLQLMLDILWELRNNEVHLGYHSYTPPQFSGLVLEAAYALLLLYDNEEFETIHSIASRIEDERDRVPEYAISVGFDFDKFNPD